MSKNNIIRLTFIFSITSAILIVGYLMVGSLPESTITISKIKKIQAASVFPEGWAFFTKNPQDEDYLIYSFQKDKNGKFINLIKPSSSPSNLFGINRKSRLQSQEVGAAVHYIVDTSWISIKGGLEMNETILDSLCSIKIPIKSNYPFFTGKYILQKIAPIPWSWAKTFNLDFRKSKITIIEFKKSIIQIR